MPCEDIVPHNVQACKHRLAVIVGVDGNLWQKDGRCRYDAPGDEEFPLVFDQHNVDGYWKT